MNKRLLNNILLDERTRKGINLFKEGCVVEVGFNSWKIESRNKNYNETYSRSNGWSCDCPDYTYRNSICKHIHAAKTCSRNKTLKNGKRDRIHHKKRGYYLSSAEIDSLYNKITRLENEKRELMELEEAY